MSVEDQVDQILFEAIKEFNEQLPADQQKVPAEKSTRLFGHNGILSSLELVNLIVITEQKLQEDLNSVINLADERAMSQKNSPFKSVESLAAYIVMLVKEQNN